MIRRTQYVAAIIFGTLFMTASAATADVLVPKSVQETFQFDQDVSASMCVLFIKIRNLPAPEIVNFRYSIIATKDLSHWFSSFMVKVGDLIFSNGRFQQISAVKLVTANIANDSFSTSGMYSISTFPDGELMGSTTDADAGMKLFGMIVKGDFDVTFQRFGDPTTRTYRILRSPSPAQITKFVGCAQQILSRQNAR